MFDLSKKPPYELVLKQSGAARMFMDENHLIRQNAPAMLRAQDLLRAFMVRVIPEEGDMQTIITRLMLRVSAVRDDPELLQGGEALVEEEEEVEDTGKKGPSSCAPTSLTAVETAGIGVKISQAAFEDISDEQLEELVLE